MMIIKASRENQTSLKAGNKIIKLLLLSLFAVTQAWHPLYGEQNLNTTVILNIDSDAIGYDDAVRDPDALTCLSSRFYNDNGEFVSEDSFTMNTFNRYQALGADPVNNIDPLGTTKQTWKHGGEIAQRVLMATGLTLQLFAIIASVARLPALAIGYDTASLVVNAGEFGMNVALNAGNKQHMIADAEQAGGIMISSLGFVAMAPDPGKNANILGDVAMRKTMGEEEEDDTPLLNGKSKNWEKLRRLLGFLGSFGNNFLMQDANRREAGEKDSAKNWAGTSVSALFMTSASMFARNYEGGIKESLKNKYGNGSVYILGFTGLSTLFGGVRGVTGQLLDNGINGRSFESKNANNRLAMTSGSGALRYAITGSMQPLPGNSAPSYVMGKLFPSINGSFYNQQQAELFGIF